MTPFDNYLIQNNAQLQIAGTIMTVGLIIGVVMTSIYCIAICIRNSKETRSQRIKRVYNHKFTKNIPHG